LRRLTRLEPPYIIALTLALVLLVVVEGHSLSALLPHYAAGLFYLHGTIYGAENPVNILTWSLEVEIQFYILVPLLVSVFRIPDKRLRRAVLVGASLVAMALQHSVFGSNARLGLSILGFIQFFLMGFLLADVYLLDWKSAPSRSLRWDAVWVVAWVAMIGVLQFASGQWVFPFLAFVVFVAAFRGTWTSRVLRTPWIYTIGGMCYSIYLIHQLVINMAHHVTLGIVPSGNYVLDLGVQLLLLVPAVLLVSALFFVWVERPFMNPRWPQDLTARVRR
jgi:peptidoglycan/LPS O-acetylase OafA/YrhL